MKVPRLLNELPAPDSSPSAGLPGERERELLAGVDAQLQVHVTQVILDRLRAEEQRRGGFARRLATGQQDGDLQLLRGQLVDRARVAAAERLAGRGELRACAVGPRVRSQRLEG